jgi:spermidine/putrescine transport system ATP-binding protein
MALLEIHNVTRRFDDFTAVDNVSLDIEAGEFFTLLGPSGCGKTTLLRMIAGFDATDGGQIILDGKDQADIPPEERNVHTVFQSYALFPHMTVEQNIAFPLKMAKVDAAAIPKKVAEALEDVRVAVARALVNRPRILLLDEPLAALDAALREEMQIELINLQKEVGITFVYVTHDQGEALALSHRIAVMNQGKVIQLDEPSKLYGFPKNRFVADFIGQWALARHQRRARFAPGKSAHSVDDLSQSGRESLQWQGTRFLVFGRCDHLRRGTRHRQAGRGDAGQFRRGPSALLRSGRPGGHCLAP